MSDQTIDKLASNFILYCWEKSSGIRYHEERTILNWKPSYHPLSRRHNRSHHSKNHWRWHKQTSPLAPISVMGSMCSRPPRHPPKHPPPGLPGPTRRSPNRLGSPAMSCFFALPDVRPFTQPIPTPSIRRSQPICDVFRGDIGPPWRFMQGVGVFGELRQTLFTFWDRVL